MTPSVPGGLPPLALELIAGHRPVADTSGMREVAKTKAAAAAACTTCAKRLNNELATLPAGLDGQFGQQFATQTRDRVKELEDSATRLASSAKQLDGGADDFDLMSTQVYIIAVTFAAQVAVDLLMAGGFIKAAWDRMRAKLAMRSVLEQGAVRMETRALTESAVRRALPSPRKLLIVGTSMGAGFGAAIPLAAQWWEKDVKHNTEGKPYNWRSVAEGAYSGAIGGGLGALTAFHAAPAIGRFVNRAAAKATGTVVPRLLGMVTMMAVGGGAGVVGGAAGTAALLAIPGTKLTATDWKQALVTGFGGGFFGAGGAASAHLFPHIGAQPAAGAPMPARAAASRPLRQPGRGHSIPGHLLQLSDAQVAALQQALATPTGTRADAPPALLGTAVGRYPVLAAGPDRGIPVLRLKSEQAALVRHGVAAAHDSGPARQAPAGTRTLVGAGVAVTSTPLFRGGPPAVDLVPGPGGGRHAVLDMSGPPGDQNQGDPGSGRGGPNHDPNGIDTGDNSGDGGGHDGPPPPMPDEPADNTPHAELRAWAEGMDAAQLHEALRRANADADTYLDMVGRGEQPNTAALVSCAQRQSALTWEGSTRLLAAVGGAENPPHLNADALLVARTYAAREPELRLLCAAAEHAVALAGTLPATSPGGVPPHWAAKPADQLTALHTLPQALGDVAQKMKAAAAAIPRLEAAAPHEPVSATTRVAFTEAHYAIPEIGDFLHSRVRLDGLDWSAEAHQYLAARTESAMSPDLLRALRAVREPGRAALVDLVVALEHYSTRTSDYRTATRLTDELRLACQAAELGSGRHRYERTASSAVSDFQARLQAMDWRQPHDRPLNMRLLGLDLFHRDLDAVVLLRDLVEEVNGPNAAAAMDAGLAADAAAPPQARDMPDPLTAPYHELRDWAAGLDPAQAMRLMILHGNNGADAVEAFHLRGELPRESDLRTLRVLNALVEARARDFRETALSVLELTTTRAVGPEATIEAVTDLMPTALRLESSAATVVELLGLLPPAAEPRAFRANAGSFGAYLHRAPQHLARMNHYLSEVAAGNHGYLGDAYMQADLLNQYFSAEGDFVHGSTARTIEEYLAGQSELAPDAVAAATLQRLPGEAAALREARSNAEFGTAATAYLTDSLAAARFFATRSRNVGEFVNHIAAAANAFDTAGARMEHPPAARVAAKLREVIREVDSFLNHRPDSQYEAPLTMREHWLRHIDGDPDIAAAIDGTLDRLTGFQDVPVLDSHLDGPDRWPAPAEASPEQLAAAERAWDQLPGGRGGLNYDAFPADRVVAAAREQATRVAQWWHGLDGDPAAQRGLVLAHAVEIGNLDGIPPHVRDEANRRVLLATAHEAESGSTMSAGARSYTHMTTSERCAQIRELVDRADALAAALPGAPEAHLLTLRPRGVAGRADNAVEIAVGNVRDARHLAVHARPFNEDPAAVLPGVAEITEHYRHLTELTDDPVAVILRQSEDLMRPDRNPYQRNADRLLGELAGRRAEREFHSAGGELPQVHLVTHGRAGNMVFQFGGPENINRTGVSRITFLEAASSGGYAHADELGVHRVFATPMPADLLSRPGDRTSSADIEVLRPSVDRFGAWNVDSAPPETLARMTLGLHDNEGSRLELPPLQDLALRAGFQLASRHPDLTLLIPWAADLNGDNVVRLRSACADAAETAALWAGLADRLPPGHSLHDVVDYLVADADGWGTTRFVGTTPGVDWTVRNTANRTYLEPDSTARVRDSLLDGKYGYAGRDLERERNLLFVRDTLNRFDAAAAELPGAPQVHLLGFQENTGTQVALGRQDADIVVVRVVDSVTPVEDMPAALRDAAGIYRSLAEANPASTVAVVSVFGPGGSNTGDTHGVALQLAGLTGELQHRAQAAGSPPPRIHLVGEGLGVGSLCQSLSDGKLGEHGYASVTLVEPADAGWAASVPSLGVDTVRVAAGDDSRPYTEAGAQPTAWDPAHAAQALGEGGAGNPPEGPPHVPAAGDGPDNPSARLEITDLRHGDMSEVGAARRRIMEFLEGNHWDDDMSIMLISSELLDNALTPGKGLPPIKVEARIWGPEGNRVFRLDVSDSNPAPPRARDALDVLADTDAEHGRGTFLRLQLAHRTEVEIHENGKTIWFEMDEAGGSGWDISALLDDGPSGPTDPIPPKDGPPPEPPPPPDPDTATHDQLRAWAAGLSEREAQQAITQCAGEATDLVQQFRSGATPPAAAGAGTARVLHALVQEQTRFFAELPPDRFLTNGEALQIARRHEALAPAARDLHDATGALFDLVGMLPGTADLLPSVGRLLLYAESITPLLRAGADCVPALADAPPGAPVSTELYRELGPAVSEIDFVKGEYTAHARSTVAEALAGGADLDARLAAAAQSELDPATAAALGWFAEVRGTALRMDTLTPNDMTRLITTCTHLTTRTRDLAAAGDAVAMLHDALAATADRVPDPALAAQTAQEMARRRDAIRNPASATPEAAAVAQMHASSRYAFEPGRTAENLDHIVFQLEEVLRAPDEHPFRVLRHPGLSGDEEVAPGYWGRYGAAGALVGHVDAAGVRHYLVVRAALGTDEGLWTLPGGALRSDEAPAQGAAREMREEVGFRDEALEALTLTGTHVSPGPGDWTHTTLVAESAQPLHPRPDMVEIDAARLVTRAELEAMAARGELLPALAESLPALFTIEDVARACAEYPEVHRRMGGDYERDAAIAERIVRRNRDALREVPRAGIVALVRYTDLDIPNRSYYRAMNAEMRSGATLSPDFAVCAQVMSAALDMMPVHAGTARRGITVAPEDLPALLARYAEGAVVTENAFVSASAGHAVEFDGNVRFEISSVTGRDISMLSLQPREGEVLFAPGSRFAVEPGHPKLEHGTWVIKLRELGPDEMPPGRAHLVPDNPERPAAPHQRAADNHAKIEELLTAGRRGEALDADQTAALHALAREQTATAAELCAQLLDRFPDRIPPGAVNDTLRTIAHTAAELRPLARAAETAARDVHAAMETLGHAAAADTGAVNTLPARLAEVNRLLDTAPEKVADLLDRQAPGSDRAAARRLGMLAETLRGIRTVEDPWHGANAAWPEQTGDPSNSPPPWDGPDPDPHVATFDELSAWAHRLDRDQAAALFTANRDTLADMRAAFRRGDPPDAADLIGTARRLNALLRRFTGEFQHNAPEPLGGFPDNRTEAVNIALGVLERLPEARELAGAAHAVYDALGMVALDAPGSPHPVFGNDTAGLLTALHHYPGHLQWMVSSFEGGARVRSHIEWDALDFAAEKARDLDKHLYPEVTPDGMPSTEWAAEADSYLRARAGVGLEPELTRALRELPDATMTFDLARAGTPATFAAAAHPYLRDLVTATEYHLTRTRDPEAAIALVRRADAAFEVAARRLGSTEPAAARVSEMLRTLHGQVAGLQGDAHAAPLAMRMSGLRTLHSPEFTEALSRTLDQLARDAEHVPNPPE